MNDQTASGSAKAHRRVATATVTIGPDASTTKSTIAPASRAVTATSGDAGITATVTSPKPRSRSGAVAGHGVDSIRQFMQQVVVWPESANAPGYINLHCHRKNTDPSKNGGKDFVVGWPFKTVDDFLSRASWVESTSQYFDVWFCTSQQSQVGENRAGKPKAVRLHRNATWLKAIWIDVDVKENSPKHYATPQDAWNAISAFRKKVGLPQPSALVNSGGGLHVYWISHVPLSPDKWRPYAEGLKQLLLAEGIKCDYGVTTDDVRILRLPGTLNHKYSPAREVKVVHLGKDYDFGVNLAFLKQVAPDEPEARDVTAAVIAPAAAPAPAFASLTPDRSLQAGIELTSEAGVGAWFARLPADKQGEVVRHAALHIAKNSKLFELTTNGGSYEEYLKLAFAIARSGVTDAESIFVEAASTARDADPQDRLREFFESCRSAELRANGVTVGTLLHIASQCGADFDRWKQTADGSNLDIALFVPGREDECRKLLDRVVADDPNTFTLGDPTGPLVILRKPANDILPSDTQWDGDLPGTTLATSADIMERAERLEWKQRAGGKGKDRLVRTHPPRSFVGDYLAQMRGRYGARPLRGIVRVPRIDDNGDIHSISGYDPETDLFHDRVPTLGIPQAPTKDVARRMAEALWLPFSKYQFDDPCAGKALVLAAIFTALERPFLAAAPMFAVRSSMPATGKGKIVRSLVRLAFDTGPVVLTWGGSSEEFEKRLAAILLQAPAALMIDNANGMQVQGDLLESMITEGRADIRPLGHSDIVKVRNRSLMTLTGNNPIITGDMARRAIPLDIVPASADPERVRYGFDPVKAIQRKRPTYLQAAFTAMRAFRLAGMPSQGLPAVGSFDEWSTRVRDLVFWLTDYDVSEVFRRNKVEDPRRQADASLLAALHQQFGAMAFKAADVIAIHKKVADSRRSPGSIAPTLAEQALHDTLDDVLGSKRIDAKLFGYCARRLNGAHNGGFILETKHDPTANANMITVRPAAAAAIVPGSTGMPGSFQPKHEDQKNEGIVAF
jgi:hypothetical protein